ncbi:MAG: OmpA family protein [Prevotella sp.]|nr:OmpA family protein [Prevotella sp.]
MSISSSFQKLTTLGRICVIVLIVGILGGGVWLAKDKLNLNFGSGDDGKYDAVLLVDTYTGWSPIVWGNGGKEGSKESEFYKRFGVKLKIIQMDDFDGATAYFKEHKNAFRFCTLDSYPVEASQSGTMTDARYFVIHNFSAGADAIVATKNIKTVADLKGKKIVCSEGTASHSLLLNTLDAAGLTGKDVEIITTGYGADVATAFKAGTADAAVVFCPDDDACIKDGPAGTHVLVSTKQINTLVTDGFLAHEEWLAKNPEKAKKIAEALLWANSEMNNPNTYKEICHVFAQEFDIPEEDVLTVGEKINFATLDDNINWFGLNTSYKGITGESLYTKMSQVYGGIGLTKATLPWRKVSETAIVESLMNNNEIGNDQSAKGTAMRKFDAPTQKIKETESFSDKEVIIEFPVDGSRLDADAETIIDREFLPIIKQFNNTYVRIEGNTDNTGNYQHNVELSKARAQSVANYLIRQGVDKNRLIIEGNGPKHAIEDGVVGSNQNYRTTSMKLVQD